MSVLYFHANTNTSGIRDQFSNCVILQELVPHLYINQELQAWATKTRGGYLLKGGSQLLKKSARLAFVGVVFIKVD
jgi:hypothetical protein